VAQQPSGCWAAWRPEPESSVLDRVMTDRSSRYVTPTS